MRRTLAAAVLAVVAATVALPAPPTAAEPDGVPATLPTPLPTPGPAPLPDLPVQAAERALEVATRVLEGEATTRDPDATMALRDLRLALPRLTGSDRRRAASLLARPTDGLADRQGDGYRTKATTKRCSANLCVHWVTKTSDKPPAGWGATTLRQMNRVWAKEIGELGYRKPLGDGTRGGNSKLDIYLKDVGFEGLYGYCAAEQKKYRYTYSGYCVLDNDFLNPQFGGVPPLDNLKVTAAHEFFHAVQYAYDGAEDGWFMESTSTWMEERYADVVDDNRQYLSSGQLATPFEPLDTWLRDGSNQYATWIFWEYLTERMGNALVKNVWKQAGSYRGAPDKFSAKALAAVLQSRGGFKETFAAYSSALTRPQAFWSEGSAWGLSAPVRQTHTLTLGNPSFDDVAPFGLDHLSSDNVRFVPSATLTGADWTLSVRVDGPSSKASPVAILLVLMKDDTVSSTPIALNSSGIGTGTVAFDPDTVKNVTLTLGNASTRFRCWRSTARYSCRGIPLDQAKAFTYRASAQQP